MRRYQAILENEGIFQSLSRKGNCYDNAVVESFFGTLKNELLSDGLFVGRKESIKQIENYIDYYNNDRIQEGLDFYSPVEYQKRYIEENKEFLEAVENSVKESQRRRNESKAA